MSVLFVLMIRGYTNIKTSFIVDSLFHIIFGFFNIQKIPILDSLYLFQSFK